MPFRFYHYLLHRHPVTVQCITSGVLAVTGDSVAQHAIEKKSWIDHQWKRSLSFALYGTFIGAPVVVLWYRFLDKLTVFKNQKMKGLLGRVLIDQAVFAPLGLFMFFSVFNLIDGQSIDDIKIIIERDYGKALWTNYKIWPAVQLVNFYWIPLHYRLAFVNLISIGWTAFLSDLNCTTDLPHETAHFSTPLKTTDGRQQSTRTDI